MLMVFLSVAALIVAAVISRRSLSGRPTIDRAIKGSLVIFAIIGLVLKQCYSFIRAGGILRDSGVFLFCSITFFLILGLMNTTFFGDGFVFWILCGSAAFLSKELGQERAIGPVDEERMRNEYT